MLPTSRTCVRHSLHGHLPINGDTVSNKPLRTIGNASSSISRVISTPSFYLSTRSIAPFNHMMLAEVRELPTLNLYSHLGLLHEAKRYPNRVLRRQQCKKNPPNPFTPPYARGCVFPAFYVPLTPRTPPPSLHKSPCQGTYRPYTTVANINSQSRCRIAHPLFSAPDHQ